MAFGTVNKGGVKAVLTHLWHLRKDKLASDKTVVSDSFGRCQLDYGQRHRSRPCKTTSIYMQWNNEHPVAIDGSLRIRVRFHSEAILVTIVLFYTGENVDMVCRLVVFPFALEEAIFVSAVYFIINTDMTEQFISHSEFHKIIPISGFIERIFTHPIMLAEMLATF